MHSLDRFYYSAAAKIIFLFNSAVQIFVVFFLVLKTAEKNKVRGYAVGQRLTTATVSLPGVFRE